MQDKPAMRSTNRTLWIAAALVALVPVVIGTIYPKVVFDPIGSLDAYMFVGLGLDYNAPLTVSTYKLSRVPWIAVEYWGRHALPPLAAQYAIQYGSHVLLGLSTFFSLRRLLGLAPAFLGAVFILVYNQLYSASPADYMNTFSAALYAATFWAVTAAATRPFSFVLYALSGAMFAFTVHTNLLFLLFAPMPIAHAFVLRRQAGLHRDFLTGLAVALGGALAGTVALGLIAVAYGHDFNFIWPQIRFLIQDSAETNATWYRPWSSGWWYNDEYGETYFGSFLAGALASAFAGLSLLLSRRLSNKRSVAQISLLFQFVFAFIVFVFVQTQGRAILQPNHSMFPLIVPFVMAIAALISTNWLSDDYRPNIPMLIALWALITVPLCWRPIMELLRGPTQGLAPFIVGFAGIGVLFVLVVANHLVRSGSPRVWFIAAALLLGVVNVQTASKLAADDLFKPTACRYFRDGYLAIVDLNRIVRSAKPSPKEVYIWVDDNEKIALNGCGRVNVGELGWSLRSLGLGATHDFLQWLALYAAEPYVLVASNEPGVAERLTRELSSFGKRMQTEPVRIEEDGLNLTFTAIRRSTL
jgi:hypothetical protein